MRRWINLIKPSPHCSSAIQNHKNKILRDVLVRAAFQVKRSTKLHEEELAFFARFRGSFLSEREKNAKRNQPNFSPGLFPASRTATSYFHKVGRSSHAGARPRVRP